MPSKFDQLGSAYLASPLMEQFGESVVYRPKGSAARTINAVINELEQQEAGTSPVFTLDVELHATRGVTLDELNRGGDEIDVTLKGQTQRRKIAGYSDPVGGFITLEIR